mmetsp:Transcript_3882/g.6062  ORF Transcript_3882/g.6062 Transcript_3882/m.6062 type:complete len:305 (-) Transcript_3882:21-935(-)
MAPGRESIGRRQNKVPVRRRCLSSSQRREPSKGIRSRRQRRSRRRRDRSGHGVGRSVPRIRIFIRRRFLRRYRRAIAARDADAGGRFARRREFREATNDGARAASRGETGGGTSRRNTNIREWRYGLRTPLEGAADIRGGGTRGGALRRTNTESGRRDVRTRVRGSYGKSVRGVRGCRTAEGGDERGCREARRRGRADDAEYGEGVRRGGRAAARRDRDDAELDRRGCIIRHRKREVARRKFSRIGARPTTFVGGERMRFANRVRSGWGGRRRGSRRRMISRGRACVIRTRALRRLPRKRRSTK